MRNSILAGAVLSAICAVAAAGAATDTAPSGLADDTLPAGAGDDLVLGTDTAAAEHIASLGLDPDKVSPTDPAITGVPRDELHDSVDRVTGTLTEEAVELRAEHGIAQSGEQLSPAAE